MLSVSVWCGGGALRGQPFTGEAGVSITMLHSAVVGLTSMVFQEECVPDQTTGLLAKVQVLVENVPSVPSSLV